MSPRVHWPRWRIVLSIIAVVAIALTTGFFVLSHQSPQQKLVAAVEEQAGQSDVSSRTPIDWLPYDIPVPANAHFAKVGNARVYLNAAPDTSFVVRPTSRGIQTLMYLTGPKAANHYAFKFHLPTGTQLIRQDDGTVNLADSVTGKTYPALSQPWAQGGFKHYTTVFKVDGATVTQTIDLADAQYPIVVDPDFDDPLTQLLEGRVPDLSAAKTATKDGPSHDFPGGRFYFGRNGLEIRMDQTGTVVAVEVALIIDGASAETLGVTAETATAAASYFGPLVKAALSMGSPNVMRVLGKVPGKVFMQKVGVGVGGLAASSTLDNEFLGGKCLGITLPKGNLGAYINRAVAFTQGNVLRAFKPLGPNDTKVWLEPCSAGPKADNANPPTQPPTNTTDTAPATPAQTIDPPAQPADPPTQGDPAPPAQNDNPPAQDNPAPPADNPAPPQDNPAPAPTYHDVSMTDVCHNQYPNAAQDQPDHYSDYNDKDSWYCVDNAGNNLGGTAIRENYCDVYYPGSITVNIDGTAYGWRCEE